MAKRQIKQEEKVEEKVDIDESTVLEKEETVAKNPLADLVEPTDFDNLSHVNVVVEEPKKRYSSENDVLEIKKVEVEKAGLVKEDKDVLSFRKGSKNNLAISVSIGTRVITG